MTAADKVRNGENALILGMRTDCTTYESVGDRLLTLVREKRPAYVCVANVHMVMEGYDHRTFQDLVNAATIVTPDGMPLVWGLRLLGFNRAERVYGPTLTLHICRRAAEEGFTVGFFGATAGILDLLKSNLEKMYPALEIAYVYAPPFRKLEAAEDELVVQAINNSGTQLLFVGLGCPKQEQWMAEHVSRIRVPMVGVGAAFDFIAGVKPQAPAWMQNAGLEWLFRLMTEPKRLWRRYFIHNPRFVALFLSQLVRERLASSSPNSNRATDNSSRHG